MQTNLTHTAKILQVTGNRRSRRQQVRGLRMIVLGSSANVSPRPPSSRHFRGDHHNYCEGLKVFYLKRGAVNGK